MRAVAQHQAQMLQARRRASILLTQTPSAQVLHLAEVDAFPQAFQLHWDAFIRIDQSIGELWRTRSDTVGRDAWLAGVLASHAFPIRATLFLLPVAVRLEITRTEWLLELYEQLNPFDLVLLLEDGDLVAFSDDEDGLHRLVVPHAAAKQK